MKAGGSRTSESELGNRRPSAMCILCRGVYPEVSEISLQSGGDSLAQDLDNVVTSAVVENVKTQFC